MGKSDCIWSSSFYLGKLVVIWPVGYIWANWLYLGKMVGFGQKVVVFGQKWLSLGKLILLGNLVVFGKSGCTWVI